MIKHLFSKLDFIGLSLDLKIDNRNVYKSLLGGVFSIFIVVISIAASISFGWSIIYKTNFTVSLSRDRELNALLNLANGFPFMLTLVKRGSVPIPELERYVNFTFISNNIQLKNNTTVKTLTYLKSKSCEAIAFNGLSKDFLEVASPKNLSYYSCLSKNQTMDIYGTIGSTNFKYLAVLINKCVNGTEIICKSNEDINNLLKNIFISIYFKDTYFANNNYTNPEQFFANMFTIPITNTVYKRQYIYFKNIDFVSDYGLLFEDKHKVSTYQLDSMYADLYFTNDAAFSDSTVAEMTVSIKNIKDVYSRSYYKLQNLAADLGGVLKVILMIFIFLNMWISEPILNNKIFDSLFVFPLPESKSKNKSKNHDIFKLEVTEKAKGNIYKFTTTERINVTSKNLISKKSNNDLNLKTTKNLRNLQTFNKIENTKLQNMISKKIKIRYRNIIFCCFRSQEKSKKLNFVNNVINNLLDVRNLLKSLNESNILHKYYFKTSPEKSRLLQEFKVYPMINPEIININNTPLLNYLTNFEDNFSNEITKNDKK